LPPGAFLTLHALLPAPPHIFGETFVLGHWEDFFQLFLMCQRHDCHQRLIDPVMGLHFNDNQHPQLPYDFIVCNNSPLCLGLQRYICLLLPQFPEFIRGEPLMVNAYFQEVQHAKVLLLSKPTCCVTKHTRSRGNEEDVHNTSFWALSLFSSCSFVSRCKNYNS